jgi:uncharacterized membrane protein YhfC
MEKNYLLVASFLIAFLVDVGLPVTLAIVAIKRFKVSGWVIFTGVLTFIASQVVHIPLLNGVALLFPKFTPPQIPTWVYAIYLGVMAGLCEETARLVGFKILKGKAKSFASGLALGIGHGGVESVIVGGLVLFSLISGLTTNSVLQSNQFWAYPWHLPLAGGLERIMAVTSHLVMTVFVWKAVTSRNYWWYALAVAFHAALDAVAGYCSLVGMAAWAIEGIVGIFFVAALILLWRFWVTERAKEKAAADVELPQPAVE